MNRTEAEHILQQRFGIPHFYDDQWEAISRILAGERVLMIQRTGFGKSLCYQFPAIVFSGLTIVFSPLIALMRDQVKSLNQRGISAAFINSEQSKEDNEDVIHRAIAGEVKILYIAPERQENKEWRRAVEQMSISMIVVDEAHTISTWGHDFRPDFRRIVDLVRSQPVHMPILATTATATLMVQQDIERQIGTVRTLRGSLDRPNFRMRVIRVTHEDEKFLWLGAHIAQLPGTGVIYTGTRLDTELYTNWLKQCGVNAITYNAGLDPEQRIAVEQGLIENRYKCVVSTNALGMGIDKPDIRFVIHTQIPQSPIHYYQEIGRGGRDGNPTEIILFFNDSPVGNPPEAYDLRIPKSFIENARPSIQKYERVIELIKDEPLPEVKLIINANLKRPQLRIIKSDLIEQGIAKEVVYDGVRHLEYQFGAPELDASSFEEIRQRRLKELRDMEQYVYTTEPRMRYLCRFLDSAGQTEFTNCDNTTLPQLSIDAEALSVRDTLTVFQQTFLPELSLCENKWKLISLNVDTRKRVAICCPLPGQVEVRLGTEVLGRYGSPLRSADFDSAVFSALRDLLPTLRARSHLTNGFATAYYSLSDVGGTIHRCKYRSGGDFPDTLVEAMVRVIRHKYTTTRFDLVVYVPPTRSGSLVQHLAERVAAAIGVPISHAVVKIRETQEQKNFVNRYGKMRNVEGAFQVDYDLTGKTVLLIDDICDSGETLKEVGRTLTRAGADYVVPLVIAKTVGVTE